VSTTRRSVRQVPGMMVEAYATCIVEKPCFEYIPKKRSTCAQRKSTISNGRSLIWTWPLSASCQRFVISRSLSHVIQGHPQYISAARDVGEMRPTIGIPISFVSPVGPSGGRFRSCTRSSVQSVIDMRNVPPAGKAYLGVDFGAHTTANDSGNIR
jgi:hypothetical protein